MHWLKISPHKTNAKRGVVDYGMKILEFMGSRKFNSGLVTSQFVYHSDNNYELFIEY